LKKLNLKESSAEVSPFGGLRGDKREGEKSQQSKAPLKPMSFEKNIIS
jgi:hypothetical protein